MKNKHEIDMSEGKLLPKLIVFAIPLVLSGILQLAFNAADLVVVGRFAGDDSLAAVGSTGALVSLIINVLFGMGTGTSVLVSRYYGAKDEKRLQDTSQTSVLVAIIGGLVVGLLGVLLCRPLLKAMGTPAEVLTLAALYLKIYFCGLPIITLYNFASAALRAVGDSKRPLYFLAIAGVLNVVMNLIFVIVFHMGVAGVALATVLSQCVSCGLTVLCLLKSDGICRLDISRLRFSKWQFGQLLRIGLPAGIQGSLFSISNVIIQSSVNSFGAIIMAGNSAGANIEGFLFVSQDAINQAAVASVSQNMGARKYDRTKNAVLNCMLLIVGVSVLMGSILLLFRRQLVGLYTTDPAAIEAGVTRMIVMVTLYFTNGFQNGMTGVMRGHGFSILPTVVTLTGVCAFRVLWIFTIFAAHRTLMVLYMSYPISWILTAGAQFTCYFLLRKRAYAKNEQLYADAA